MDMKPLDCPGGSQLPGTCAAAAPPLSPRDGVRVVLFDAVGTLIRPAPPVAEVYHAAGQRHGSLLSQDQVRARFASSYARFHGEERSSEEHERRRWQSIVANIFDDVPASREGLFQELWDHFARASSWRLYPDVADTWEQLCRCGRLVGIASNFDARLLGICQALPPLDRAELIFCSSRIGYAKPHRDFFERIQQQLDVPPRAILLVGDDRRADVDGALAAGWRAVWLDRTAKAQGEGSISNLSQLLDRMPGAA